MSQTICSPNAQADMACPEQPGRSHAGTASTIQPEAEELIPEDVLQIFRTAQVGTNR